MKTETLFASLLLFLSTCLPVALAVGYPVLDQKPPPGHSGVHYDKPNNAIHTYYGDKDMPQHMEHLMYNQRKHPENNRPFKVGPSGSTSNREGALEGVKPVPGRARDEKPPNSMVHDGKKTTVRYLSTTESSKHLLRGNFTCSKEKFIPDMEMKLLSTTTRKARSTGAKVQLHANPSANYNGRGAKSLSRAGSPTPGPTRQRASSAPPPLRGTSSGRNASPGSARSGSVGRGSRTPSPKPAWNAGPGKQPKSPSSRAGSPNKSPGRTPSPKPASNAGRQRAGSAPPPSRGRPLTRTTTPTGSRGSRPVQNAGARGRSPARNATPGPSRQRNATPGPSQPKKVATPNKPKPAWNAGPGARAKSPSPPPAGPRRSSRLAAPKPPPKPQSKPPSGKKK